MKLVQMAALSLLVIGLSGCSGTNDVPTTDFTTNGPAVMEETPSDDPLDIISATQEVESGRYLDEALEAYNTSREKIKLYWEEGEGKDLRDNYTNTGCIKSSMEPDAPCDMGGKKLTEKYIPSEDTLSKIYG